MEYILFILLVLLIYIILLIVLLTVTGLIIDNKFNKKSKKEKEIYKKINDYLINYCDKNNIPLKYGEEYFKEDHNSAAGYIVYSYTKTKNSFEDLVEYKNYRIYIRDDKYKIFTWTTLAHEIGHYLSISLYKDQSEYGADFEADKLVRNIITSKEAEIIHMTLNIFFNEEELKNFSHIKYKLGLWNPQENMEKIE